MVSSKALIIAEIGQNHLGEMGLAKQLIELAKQSGASLVKFQLYDHNMLYKEHPEIPDVALSFDQAKMLFDYGKDIGIEVFFSVFDVERVRWCEEIGVRHYKIAYSQSTNLDLREALLRTRKHVFISTARIDTHISNWDYLYCVPKYPAPLKEMLFGLNIFGCDAPPYWDGFSDHTIGLDVSKIALARGAGIIEKHFTIDHKTGIDAEWSITPEELRELVRFSKIVEGVL